MKFGHPAPIELLRWELAERYGWTLDEIGALSMADIHEFLQIMDGKTKAQSSQDKRH